MPLKVVGNCNVQVPGAFTPNNDAKNDYLYPINAYNTSNLIFRIYNRHGLLVFETKDWTKKWDGTLNGDRQPAATYVWTLDYTDVVTGARVHKKGTTCCCDKSLCTPGMNTGVSSSQKIPQERSY